jgi:UDP-glucose 4-epimerase
MMDTEPAGATIVAVLGGSGFLGRAIIRQLRSRGVAVRPVPAPRLEARIDELTPTGRESIVDDLAARLDGARVVVNAAGIADPAAPHGPGLYGANTLLPLLVARAGADVKVERFVHVSSISVQGDGDLDETSRTAPFSPYSRSRALAERLLLAGSDLDTVVFRPTSVHGPDRAVTRSLVRFARSGLSCVAGAGSASTPQVLVSDVAAAVTELALTERAVPPIVIQPPNGMTTGMLLRLLGGHEPRHLPDRLARTALRTLRRATGSSLTVTAHARRVEMLLFGRRQVPGWLAEQGLAPGLEPPQWQCLAAAAGAR